MQQRLERILELDPAPLTVPRDPSERQIALCRDFAVFLTSILRHKGIPARLSLTSKLLQNISSPSIRQSRCPIRAFVKIAWLCISTAVLFHGQVMVDLSTGFPIRPTTERDSRQSAPLRFHGFPHSVTQNLVCVFFAKVILDLIEQIFKLFET
jgi:hypothetical protein